MDMYTYVCNMLHIYMYVLVFVQASQRKLRQAQSSLQDSEQRKNSRLKMLRKTHQSAMSMKQRLITDLQDILQEREELIRGLEARLRTGGGHTSSSSSSSPSSKPAPLSSNNNSPVRPINQWFHRCIIYVCVCFVRTCMWYLMHIVHMHRVLNKVSELVSHFVMSNWPFEC